MTRSPRRIAGARYTGWQGLLDLQRECLDVFWDSADVEVEGDPDCQQAVRFGLFHVFQASARAERRAIPGKGLTGTGYDGHAFWDTEGYRASGADLHGTHGGRRCAAMAGLHLGPRQGPSRAARPRRARPSRGGPSMVRSARRTGPRGPRHGTSMPTSRWHSNAIALSRAMIRWKSSAAWPYSWRRRDCGFRWGTTTGTGCGISTASPVPTSTPRSCGTTSSPT